jgi:large subunit ribosomal protein L23
MSETFNTERLMQVILAPQVSEKATYIAEKHNHVIFRVAQDATKSEIKAAVELMWKPQNIEVKSVQIANVKGKKKRFGRFIGRRSNWKKAYVSIQSGQEINFSDIAQGEVK